MVKMVFLKDEAVSGFGRPSILHHNRRVIEASTGLL